MKASKKLLSLLLVVMLLVSAIPFQVFAKTVNEDGTIVVPVTVEYNGESYYRSFTVDVDADTVLSEDFAMNNSVLVNDPSTKEFAGWFRGDEEVTGNTIRYSWLKETAPADYALTLKLNPKSDPAPDPEPEPEPAPTYTATLKATLDGHEVGSATRTGTSIDLTEELAQSLYTGFDADKHEFKGWADGLSGPQNLTADATFTAVFETIPAPTYSVTVNVYYNNRFKTTQVLTEKTSVTLNNALLEDVYADFDASEETAQWYRGAVGSTAIATGTTETLSANATYSVNITPIVDVKYHNIKVYAVKYVGNGTTFVNQGVVSTPIFDSGNIEGTVNVLDYLESTENWGVIETNANKIGKIRTNPTFYTDSALTTRLKNETLTDASKVVYVRVDVEEVKNVLLYVHKGSSVTNLTNLDPKVLHGYEVGDYVEYADVQKILGSNVKFYGLFTEERWGNLNASIKDDQLPKIQVPAGGVEIHVWVYSGNVSNADTTNPKTGDYILTTAVSLMVISGLAAAAVYVVGKKRRV